MSAENKPYSHTVQFVSAKALSLLSSGCAMAEAGNIRLLSPAENLDVEKRWIRKIRRSLWVEGGATILWIFLALNYPKQVFFTAIAAVFGLACLSSLRSLHLLARDLSAGTAEEILGSVHKQERSFLEALPALLGPALAFAGELALNFLKAAVLSRGKYFYFVAAGAPLVLVKPHSTEIICVERGTYHDLADGALVKAVVLPLSRVGFKVNRTGLGDR
jgi:hypothetical protein